MRPKSGEREQKKTDTYRQRLDVDTVRHENHGKELRRERKTVDRAKEQRNSNVICQATDVLFL